MEKLEKIVTQKKLTVVEITVLQVITLHQQTLQNSLLPRQVMQVNHVRTDKYTMRQKKRRQTLGHNFINKYPIFKIFSPADSVVNLQQIHVSIFHHALNISRHYLAKYECQKNGIILKYVLQLMMNHKVV